MSKIEGLSDLRFPFGKYKFHHLWEVADSDPGYIYWWITNSNELHKPESFSSKLKEYYKIKFPHGH